MCRLGGAGTPRHRRSTRGELHRWKQRRGPAGHVEQEPFWSIINHTDLVVEIDGRGGVKGFIDKLRSVPAAEVEEKQRRIEAVRHHLLYNMEGSQPDAFSATLRQLVAHLPPRARGEQSGAWRPGARGQRASWR